MKGGELFVLGAVFGILSLIVWNNMVLLSLLSPAGPQFLFFGFRVKHYMLGAVLVGLALLFRSRSKWSYFVVGFGLALFLDELDEVVKLFL
jgi:hypothetical protein